jgi:hypothetical protein
MLSLIPWKTILLHIADKAAGAAVEFTKRNLADLIDKAREIDQSPSLDNASKKEVLKAELPDLIPGYGKNLIVELVVFYIRIK